MLTFDPPHSAFAACIFQDACERLHTRPSKDEQHSVLLRIVWHPAATVTRPSVRVASVGTTLGAIEEFETSVSMLVGSAVVSAVGTALGAGIGSGVGLGVGSNFFSATGAGFAQQSACGTSVDQSVPPSTHDEPTWHRVPLQETPLHIASPSARHFSIAQSLVMVVSLYAP